MTNSHAHVAAQLVAAPFERTFNYMADPEKLGRWSLGCFGIAVDPGTGLHAGTSLYDGSRAFVRIAADRAAGLIDYHVGAPENLAPRIFCRVSPGEPLGHGPDHSIVALVAWRAAAMSDERWLRLVSAHEAEIWLIKEQIETEHARARR